MSGEHYDTDPGARARVQERYIARELAADRRELVRIILNTLEASSGIGLDRRELASYIAGAIVESRWPTGPRPDPVTEGDLWRGYGLARRLER